MLEVLHTPLTVLHVFACMMLVLIVLIQPGKSGGISAALGGAGAQQVFGGRGAGNFLTKGTWVLATTFFTTSVVLAYMSSSVEDTLDARAAMAAEPKEDEIGPVKPAAQGATPPAAPEPLPAQIPVAPAPEEKEDLEPAPAPAAPPATDEPSLAEKPLADKPDTPAEPAAKKPAPKKAPKPAAPAQPAPAEAPAAPAAEKPAPAEAPAAPTPTPAAPSEAP